MTAASRGKRALEVHEVGERRPVPAPDKPLCPEKRHDGRRDGAGTRNARFIARPRRKHHPSTPVRVLDWIHVDRPAIGVPGQFVFPRLRTKVKADAVVGGHRPMVIPAKRGDRDHARDRKSCLEQRFEDGRHALTERPMDDQLTAPLSTGKVPVREDEDDLFGEDATDVFRRPIEAKFGRERQRYLVREVVVGEPAPSREKRHESTPRIKRNETP